MSQGRFAADAAQFILLGLDTVQVGGGLLRALGLRGHTGRSVWMWVRGTFCGAGLGHDVGGWRLKALGLKSQTAT